MALLKETTNRQGFTGNYWRITFFYWNAVNQYVEVTVSLYKDQAARVAGYQAMDSESFMYGNFDIVNLEGANPLQDMYNLLKQESKFADAEDI